LSRDTRLWCSQSNGCYASYVRGYYVTLLQRRCTFLLSVLPPQQRSALFSSSSTAVNSTLSHIHLPCLPCPCHLPTFAVPLQPMRTSPFASLCAALLLCLAHLTRASPTTPPIPGTWMLAAQGLSCTAACAARSPPAPCHLASLQSVATELDFERIRDSTLNHTDVRCAVMLKDQQPHAPSLDASQAQVYFFNPCQLGSEFSTCEASDPNLRRFCCCGDTQCSSEYVPRWQSEGLDIAAPAIRHPMDMYAFCLYLSAFAIAHVHDHCSGPMIGADIAVVYMIMTNVRVSSQSFVWIVREVLQHHLRTMLYSEAPPSQSTVLHVIIDLDSSACICSDIIRHLSLQLSSRFLLTVFVEPVEKGTSLATKADTSRSTSVFDTSCLSVLR
jgi:hypothetical protein